MAESSELGRGEGREDGVEDCTVNYVLLAWLTGAFVMGLACVYFDGIPGGWKARVDFGLVILLWPLSILIMTARQLRGK